MPPFTVDDIEEGRIYLMRDGTKWYVTEIQVYNGVPGIKCVRIERPDDSRTAHWEFLVRFVANVVGKA